MIISQTPFRVSFAGGGTDLPAFSQHEFGAVLSTTIDHHIYVTIHRRFEPTLRVSYSRTEEAKSIDEVRPELVRAAMRLTEIDEPLEITTILCEHPGVLEAATIGVPDRVYGEAAACFVVAKPGQTLTSEAIMGHLKPRLSEFKMPQSVSFMSSLPKTDRAKVSKDKLLEYWREHVRAQEATAAAK